jgi:DNA-binding NtrC family response regulator
MGSGPLTESTGSIRCGHCEHRQGVSCSRCGHAIRWDVPEPPIPTLDEAEKALVRRALARYPLAVAAERLGVSRWTLLRKAQRMGLIGKKRA